MPRVFNDSKGQINVSGVKGLPNIVLQAGACHTFKNYEEYHRYMKRLILFKDLIRIDLTPVVAESKVEAPKQTAPVAEPEAQPMKRHGSKPKQEAEAKVVHQEQKPEVKVDSSEPQSDPAAV